MKAILEKIGSDARSLNHIEYGGPRAGHPEGKIKFHIKELEENWRFLT